MIGSLVVDTCDNGHKFGKLLPHHPAIEGKHRCPNCMAEGLDSERAMNKELERTVTLKNSEIRNLEQAAGFGNH